MKSAKPQKKTNFKKLILAAQGQLECDLQIADVLFLDVFNGIFRKGTISILDGKIIGLEEGIRAKRKINGKNKWLVPGFIDAHVHLESSMLSPSSFENSVLPKGTTTAICDPHELSNVIGLEGIRYFLKASTKMSMDLKVMLSSCVPATHLETNGGGTISASDLRKLKNHPSVLGLAEVMNVPGVLSGNKDILDKLNLFDRATNRQLDGHCPLLSGKELSAYATAGITSCHESSSATEAVEKLKNGLKIWIREGSVAKDLDALISILTPENSMQIGFCTDDRNPLDILEQGHLDYLIRRAIAKGANPNLVYRCASYSIANHYGLVHLGAIAPGYQADLVLLNDLNTCSIDQVYKKGKPVSELQSNFKITSQQSNKTMKAKPPLPENLRAPEGQVHVIGVKPGKILTEHLTLNSNSSGVLRLSVLERHGHKRNPANAWVTGFGNLNGAIASSVGHDSHNLICVGSNQEDMAIAMNAVIKNHGGFAVSQNKNVLATLSLPIGGLMSPLIATKIAHSLANLRQASKQIGCSLEDPFLQLAFLSLPVIPSLKLTDRGLVDVNKFNFIPVRI
ncbi:MAG: adenine deaminase [Bacteriovoracia bacterium]